MRALAAYIMRGPVQAIVITVVTALISLISVLGMVSLLSGAVVALVTLRQGVRQGLVVVFGASVVVGVAMYFIFGTAIATAAFLLLLWLPLLLLSVLLRGTSSWSMLLDAAAGLGLIGVVVFYLMTGNPVQFWQSVLNQFADVMGSESGMADNIAMFRDQIPVVANWMTGMVAAAVVVGLVLSMVLARWWQALLYNPGGFKQEFYNLRQSRISAIVIVVIISLSLLQLDMISRMAGDILITAIVIYSIVGLSLVHSMLAGKHPAWLVAVYALLFFMPPHIMLALAGASFIDSWMNFRARLPSGRQ